MEPPFHLRIFACPLANKPENTGDTSFSEGNEACVSAHRRNWS
jgi:hypothetical protein